MRFYLIQMGRGWFMGTDDGQKLLIFPIEILNSRNEVDMIFRPGTAGDKDPAIPDKLGRDNFLLAGLFLAVKHLIEFSIADHGQNIRIHQPAEIFTIHFGNGQDLIEIVINCPVERLGEPEKSLALVMHGGIDQEDRNFEPAGQPELIWPDIVFGNDPQGWSELAEKSPDQQKAFMGGI